MNEQYANCVERYFSYVNSTESEDANETTESE